MKTLKDRKDTNARANKLVHQLIFEIRKLRKENEEKELENE